VNETSGLVNAKGSGDITLVFELVRLLTKTPSTSAIGALPNAKPDSVAAFGGEGCGEVTTGDL